MMQRFTNESLNNMGLTSYDGNKLLNLLFVFIAAKGIHQQLSFYLSTYLSSGQVPTLLSGYRTQRKLPMGDV